MIKTRTILICLLLGTAICLPQAIKGQVTIGDNKEPKSFSVLELIDEVRGLRMPPMTTAQRDAINMGTVATTAAMGLTIYNTDINCMEYWNGTTWVSTCGDASLPDPGGVVFNPTYNTATANTNLFTGVALIEGTGDEKTRGTDVLYTDVDAGVFNYTDGEGQVLPRLVFSHPSGLSVIIPTQTLNGSTTTPASGQITILVSGIPSTAYAGKAFDIPITLLGSTLTVRVNIGCGAYTSADKVTTDDSGIAVNWLQFQCFNLGADTTLDPLTPAADLHGDKYRFGAKEPSITMAIDRLDNGSSSWNSKPVENSDNVDWTEENNPCGPGWRLPTSAEWSGVLNNANNECEDLIKSSWSSYRRWDTGHKYGSCLFLPASGYRATGSFLTYIGQEGMYWSSTSHSVSYAFFGSFSSGSTSGRGNGFSDKRIGTPIRCVSE